MNKKAFTQIKNKNHPRVFLSGVYNACCGRMSFLKRQYVEDPRLQTSGMVLLFNKGFTLIELLVVVLIIGILAAIALPQYQVAVVKARVGTMLPMLKSIAQADQSYFLANGEYTSDATQLDIEPAGNCVPLEAAGPYHAYGKLWKCGDDFLLDNSVGNTVRVYANYCPGHNTSWNDCENNRDFNVYIQLYNGRTDDYSWQWGCTAVDNSSSLGTKMCNALKMDSL